MEKKTIGAFIAALRKANGLTQKQLAEMLNVSDKSVSRWERDECAPDLTLIPVMAEIFGVSSDELLRGERRCPDSAPEYVEKKTEKQLRRALNSALTKLRVRSTISIGLALLGLIAAMICNFGFTRGYLGFYIGTACYLAAVLTEAVFLTLALSSIAGDEFDGPELQKCKGSMLRLGIAINSATVVLFAGTLPLVVDCWDAYTGLTGSWWAQRALVFGGISAVLCLIVCRVITIIAAWKNGTLTERNEKILKLQKRTIAIALAVLLVTFFGQWAFNGITDGMPLVPGIEFDNWEDFKAYIEEPRSDWNEPLTFHHSEEYEDVYTTESGDYVYIWTADRHWFATEPGPEEGTILCEFIPRNEYVWTYRANSGAADLLPITVYTQQHRGETYDIVNTVNFIIAALYVLEIVVFIVIYQKKKRQTT